MDQASADRFLEIMAAGGGQGNMWDLGQSLGLDRSDTETLVLDLAAEGFLEMKSLSGGVALTEAGRRRAGTPGSAPDAAATLALLESLDPAGWDEDQALNFAADRLALAAQLERRPQLAAVLKTLALALVQALENRSEPEARSAREGLRALWP